MLRFADQDFWEATRASPVSSAPLPHRHSGFVYGGLSHRWSTATEWHAAAAAYRAEGRPMDSVPASPRHGIAACGLPQANADRWRVGVARAREGDQGARSSSRRPCVPPEGDRARRNRRVQMPRLHRRLSRSLFVTRETVAVRLTVAANAAMPNFEDRSTASRARLDRVCRFVLCHPCHSGSVGRSDPGVGRVTGCYPRLMLSRREWIDIHQSWLIFWR